MSLDDVRARIDELDDRIVHLLAARQKLVEQAATYKRDADAVRAPDRRRRVMERLAERADAAGLDQTVAAATYTAMIDAFIELELGAAGH